jgi:apolipoprotein N-acyltransferase
MSAPPRGSRWAGCATAFVAGLLTSLAFPPAGLWPVAFVGLVPLLIAVRGQGPARGSLYGLCYGVGLYGTSLYWIALFGAMAWTALVLLCAGSTALFGAVIALALRRDRPIGDAFVVAAAWTAMDWIRGMWPLGGFTWSSLGISQVANHVTLPLASVTGVWGVTFVVVLVNAAIAAEITRQGSGARRWTLAVLAAAAVLAPSVLPAASANGGPLDIAVVQIDVRVPVGTSPVEEDRIVAQRNIEEHRTIATGPKSDLVVWGEGALDPGALADPATFAEVQGAIASVGVPTTIGAVVNDPGGIQRTSVLAFDASGQLADRYDKVHLVPFGEYVPWRSRLRWIDALKQIPVDRVPGDRIHTIAQPGIPPYGTPICFENAFPDLTRDFVRDGARFLVVPVNNASYGFTAAAAQHLQMSQMRAVETGRWVVDAGVSGISAFIDPDGRALQRTGLFQTAILRGRILTSTVETTYVRYGDVLPVACCLIVLFGMLVPPRRRSIVRPAPGPLPAPPRGLAVLPTYNERDTIEQVVTGVLALPGLDVLVVDDSSPDGTAEVVRGIAATQPRVRLVSRPGKSGLASAYLEGFRVALAEGYDVAIEMDSDLSHDPAELPALLGAAERHDLVVGSRYIPGGSVTDWSRSRVALSRAGNAYARLMLGLPIHDATSGYRIYRRDLLDELLRRPFAADGYGFQIELVLRAHRLGADVGEAPITFRERAFGESKISRSIIVEALWMVTRWGFDLRFRPGASL